MDDIINKNSVSLGFIWLLPHLFQDKPPILMLSWNTKKITDLEFWKGSVAMAHKRW